MEPLKVHETLEGEPDAAGQPGETPSDPQKPVGVGGALDEFGDWE